ncbi:hypothetical protein JMB70_003616 [Salmonella enterica]|uniref:hypothetical protein n=1 Tax=Salmonella enterica TaxID=28901 RepID=UPI001375903E|nr:hypothetical protein [Salmonella enterica]EHA6586962.1 hypothetical protein [Salmonella enterica]EKS2520628.1 hypothetical protein [Salmonella enterica]
MHKKRSKCRAQVTGEQPTQQGLEGNPGENVAKSPRERFCVQRTGTRWRGFDCSDVRPSAWR